jgi:monofunctional biosynthetic peptidoglycan transglycosylase
VIIAEDGRFCSHHGVDFQELRDAIADADDLDDLRGGSTITQQVAKNLFLWPGRSWLRKALEFPLALWIDLVLSKRRVLEIYLNIAEWGPSGEFGVEAGSRRAFGKPARDLTRHEAALLAAVLPSPAQRNARAPGPGLRRLALYVARSARSPEAATSRQTR